MLMLQYSVNCSSLFKDAFDDLGQKQVVLIHCRVIAGKPNDIIIYHYIIVKTSPFVDITEMVLP